MSTFTWQGQELQLFDHPYNATITNERAVEVPIAWDFLARMNGGHGLEVGNVLAHYEAAPYRRIVDLYEHGLHVENLDVFDIRGTYDWIVSVSTIEHIRPENTCGPIAAFWYLLGLLNPGGRMLLTAGAGQSAMLDAFLLGEGEAVTLVRVADYAWRQTRVPDVRPYGPTHGARSVWIGEWSRTGWEHE